MSRVDPPPFFQRAPRARLAGGSFLFACAIVLAALLTAVSARAQHCQGLAAEPSARGVELSLRSEAARFRTDRYEGDYQGLFVRGAWRSRRLSAQLSAPYYHIVRNGLGARGFGDVLLDGRLELMHERSAPLHGAALLALSLPTGDSAHDLGMAHWMLAPGASGSVSVDRYSFELRGSYARSFGGGARHQHAPGAFPIVEPMNHSELDGALRATARANRVFSTRLALYGALPLPASEGVARAAASFAGDLRIQSARFSLEAHLPLLGDAFRGKIAAELGFAF
ncbi:MAG TPA: hypothetical protein VG937_15140 [Polyangiaceae bacterium]|nr:hypothetical protein [Polyangiaceae bacterium]